VIWMAVAAGVHPITLPSHLCSPAPGLNNRVLDDDNIVETALDHAVFDPLYSLVKCVVQWRRAAA
jgi:hypothetical protein